MWCALPWAPLKPCRWAGCPELTKDRFCPQHQKQDWKRQDSERVRVYDYQSSYWRRLRAQVLQQEPLCRLCLNAHPRRLRPAEEVDHIVDVRDGGSDQRSNLQALCRRCHSRKTILHLGLPGHGSDPLIAGKRPRPRGR